MLSRRGEEGSILTATGVGDTFGVCCLYHVLTYGLEYLDEQKLAQMLIFANAVASIIMTRKGALCVMLLKEEMKSLIAKRGGK